jgi:transposase-like protein
MDAILDLSKLAKHFSDEAAARKLLERMRWRGNPGCPHCGGADPYQLNPKEGSKTRQGLWKCRACRQQFTVTVGTIFEDSHIPLSKWLLAIHLICASKKGMSAHQLHRMLGITYKTAWFMAHRLRYAMSQEPLASKLRGVVEVDETYVGGKRKGRTGRPAAGDQQKTAVMALVERGGRVRAMPLECVTSKNVREIIAKHIDFRQSELMTDEANVYAGYGAGPMPHHTVNHGRGEYVRGSVHTNTVEGFFSLLKRGINGSFHHVSKQHLHRYCDEFSFRYSARHVSDGERAGQLVLAAEGKRLTYRQPAGASQN